jgi:hypothetical protein
MKSKKSTDIDLSSVKINEELNKYAHQNLFPEKLAEANRILSETPLPKALREKK